MKNYKELNYLLFRAVMGINMTIHGSIRIFGNYEEFITRMQAMFAPTFIPNIFVTIGANLISPFELLFGLFLLVGFKTKESLLLLTLIMMMLISGVCLLQKWDLAGMQMSYVLYLFFLGLYVEYNQFSVDKLIEKGRS